MANLITIFGSTGNLMYKKLFPALTALGKQGHLDEKTKILCIGRADFDTDSYIKDAKEQLGKLDISPIESFIIYVKMDITNLDDYNKIKDYIQKNGKTLDHIFYLATPPDLFPTIAKGVSQAKLIEKGDESSRIVFEKPFGEDLKSAHAINKELWEYFDESQIYRIDHYLGKEMIQNILVMRFANRVFENNWSNEAIKSISIIAKEEETVMSRGNYYDKVGALKDMVQSHLMQMAALTLMNEPESFDANGIRAEKVKVLEQLKVDKKDIVLGQYEGYLDEKNIPKSSNTETFVFFKATVDNHRWKNVPIYFLTGKNLDDKRSEIIIEFKSNTHSKKLWDTHLPHNKLIIKVSPEEGIYFQLNVKSAGLTDEINPVPLDYCHNCNILTNSPEAYERLLLDLVNKNATLFTRWDEIETSWKIIDEIKKYDQKCYVYKNYKDIVKTIKAVTKEALYDL
ncbi:MAG: glucose-6-phosphate dehydrogenase [Candidatus Izemoplasmataceae bacterium]|jgi:glucose-6-phosphate 1-dehydrogenase